MLHEFATENGVEPQVLARAMLRLRREESLPKSQLAIKAMNEIVMRRSKSAKIEKYQFQRLDRLGGEFNFDKGGR